MDAVGDVVGEVHHLRLDASEAADSAGAHPGEDGGVLVVHAELADRTRQPVAVATARLRGISDRPGVLGGGIERGPGEVEPETAPVVIESLRLEPGQQPQRLRVALEPADVLRRLR